MLAIYFFLLGQNLRNFSRLDYSFFVVPSTSLNTIHCCRCMQASQRNFLQHLHLLKQTRHNRQPLFAIFSCISCYCPRHGTEEFQYLQVFFFIFPFLLGLSISTITCSLLWNCHFSSSSLIWNVLWWLLFVLFN